MRKLFIMVAAFLLAMGSSIAFAGAAQADTGNPFSVSFNETYAGLSVSGDKYTDSTITDVVMDDTNNEDSPVNDITDGTDENGQPYCTGLGTGSGTWACNYADSNDPSMETGENYQLKIVEQDSDGSIHDHMLNFDFSQEGTDTDAGVLHIDAEYPIRTYTFTPDGVTVTEALGQDETEGVLSLDLQTEDGDGGFNEVTDCTAFPCSAALTPGEGEGPYYETLFRGIEGDDNQTKDWFVLYESPEVESVVAAASGDRAVVSGDGFYGDEGSYGDPESLTVFDGTKAVCTTTVVTDEGGDWSCTTTDLGAGTHNLYAAVQDLGSGWDYAEGDNDGDYSVGDYSDYVIGTFSNPSNSIPITFAAPPVAPTTPLTGSGDITPIWSFTIVGDTSDIEPGDTITVSGSGLPAGTALDIELHSNPIDLGSAVVASDGTFTQTVTIPENAPPGDHQIIITATGPGLVTTSQNAPLTIQTRPVTSTPAPTPTPKPTKQPAAGGSGTGSGTGTIQPNILSEALTPIADVAVHPNKIVSAIEIGLVLLLLAVLPAHLLESTIAEQSDRFERRFKNLPKQPAWLKAIGRWFTNAPVAAGIVVTLLTAVVLGFADPHFGWTLASLRLILASAIALFLVGYVANRLTAAIARNQWHILVTINTRPWGIILTIIGVIVSRVLDFAPGFLIGLILGLSIQGKSAAGYAWRTVVTRTSIVLIMAIAAWIAYSTINLGGDEGGTFGTALLVETLVAVTTEGIVALLVELLPFRFLEGERVYAHSRILWGVFYVFTLIVFVVAVIPWTGNWSVVGSSLWIWVIVLAAFTVVCLGVYFYFRRFAKPLEEEAGSEEVSLGETVKGDKS